MIIQKLSDNLVQLTDDDNNTYYIESTGINIIKNNVIVQQYKNIIDGKEYAVLGNKDIIEIDGHRISRVDELIYSVFNEIKIPSTHKIVHLDGNTLNNNLSNITILNENETTILKWNIDENKVVNGDLKVLLSNEKLASKYKELKTYLEQDPYRLPYKFRPRDGLKYNKKYMGYEVYHAVIDKGSEHRVFYIIKNGVVIIESIEYKGIVEILQSLGHDY